MPVQPKYSSLELCGFHVRNYLKDLGTNKKSGKFYQDRNSGLKKRFNINAVEFDQLFKSQNFMCAICRKGNNSNKNFHLDHCHKTGKVRGVLCHNCNTAIGLMKDSTASLENAIEYIKKHSKTELLPVAPAIIKTINK